MSWLVCEDVPDEYVPMMLEEMELDGADLPRATIDAAPDGAGSFQSVVIGCGQSGLLAGIRLREAGIPFTIIEKNAGVGGTWWENSYPGAGSTSATTSTATRSSRATTGPSTSRNSRDPVVLRGCDGAPRDRAAHPLVHRGGRRDGSTTEVCVVVRIGRRRGRDACRPAVISRVGQLNRPNLPDIPGADDFAGPAFHTARWDHGVDLTGKDVVLLGAGASGFQIAPTIAAKSAELTVFQRTARVDVPNPNYRAPVGPGVRSGDAAPAVLRPLVSIPAVLATFII